MHHTKNNKFTDRSRTDLHANFQNEGTSAIAVTTVTKKPSPSDAEALCTGQKSFISIHSTDQLCQANNEDSKTPVSEQCNVEVISLNEVFPSTSDESVTEDATNDTQSPKKRWNRPKDKQEKQAKGQKNPGKSYAPSNSKSTVSARQSLRVQEDVSPSAFSDYSIPKSTLYVTGSNPGEPKKAFPDSPKKISKTMKKFLRNIDKHKIEQTKSERSKQQTRGILKDGRSGPESTGDYSVPGADQTGPPEIELPFPMDFSPQITYGKHQQDKNVTFNTQVVIIHFNGDLCLGQSVEALSKEKDQQARNSELRKTFLKKYNEFWPTQK